MEKISVCLRVRPLTQKEINDRERTTWDVGQKKISIDKGCLKELITQKKIMSNMSYEFNHCFDDKCDNLSVFQTSVRDVVLQAMEGINGTLLMYGQTGSGKTFTMLGSKNQELQQKNTVNLEQFIKQSLNNATYNDIGILIYSMMELFKQINLDEKRQYEVKCSYYEIYNENVYDLLRDEQEMAEALIFGTDYRKEFVIRNLKEFSVTSLDEVFKIVGKGERNRHYAETILNHQSSRSHTVFKVLICAYGCAEEEGDTTNSATEACMNFIDLAGSEKITQTVPSDDSPRFVKDEYNQRRQTRDRSKESQSINKSLFFLTRVIALKTQKVPPQHIPYRNSTLTKLLKSSLTGNFKTLIILSINPGLSQYDQTHSTLRFGISAKLVEQKAEQNIVVDPHQASQRIQQLLQKQRTYEKTIQEQEQQIQMLKAQLINAGQGDQIHTPPISQISMNQDLEKNCQDMHKKLLKSNEQILNYFNAHMQLEEQLKEVQCENDKLQRITQTAMNRLDCYEGNPKVQNISDQELIDFEYILESNLAKVKLEKIARNQQPISQILEANPQHQLDKGYILDLSKSDRSEQPTMLSQSSELGRRIDTEEYNNSLYSDERAPIPKSFRKTPTKEARPRLQTRQISYYQQKQTIPKAVTSGSKSPNISRSPLRKKGSLKQAKQLAKYIQDENDIQQFQPEISKIYQSPQKTEPTEQEQLTSDISSLADRLSSLSDKFSLRKDGRSNRYLMNTSQIIFETESETLESRNSVHNSNKQSKSANKQY